MALSATMVFPNPDGSQSIMDYYLFPTTRATHCSRSINNNMEFHCSNFGEPLGLSADSILANDSIFLVDLICLVSKCRYSMVKLTSKRGDERK